ncbi:hypothetical protein BBJ28_00019962 [Nothophytophthora sp. Chile5]|nr:hypothetical protein BBJ28_00019962 [Nothophytophthora sp. Chile5]
MAGRKSAATRKRGPPARSTARKAKGGAPAATTQKKKETLAAKKKHVRDLAKAGRWHEVKKTQSQVAATPLLRLIQLLRFAPKRQVTMIPPSF